MSMTLQHTWVKSERFRFQTKICIMELWKNVRSPNISTQHKIYDLGPEVNLHCNLMPCTLSWIKQKQADNSSSTLHQFRWLVFRLNRQCTVKETQRSIYFVACEMAMMFWSGLLHSSVADLTRRCCLINHDLVKGEADQAGEREKKEEMKKRKKREIGRGDHNEWLPTVTSSGFRLKLSVLPGRLNTFKAREKKLSVYMCVWEKRQRQGHNPTEALCTLVMRWVLLVARICRMTGRLLGGGTDEKWTDSRMVILSWGACDGACTVARIMRHTLQSNHITTREICEVIKWVLNLILSRHLRQLLQKNEDAPTPE